MCTVLHLWAAWYGLLSPLESQWYVHLPYHLCVASFLLAFGLLALQGSKSGIGPDQGHRMFALILHNDVLTEAMT